jgi:hypothetical protein
LERLWLVLPSDFELAGVDFEILVGFGVVCKVE